MTGKKFIEIVCPGCRQDLAHVKADSDVFCPRCSRFIYLGLKGDEAVKARAST